MEGAEGSEEGRSICSTAASSSDRLWGISKGALTKICAWC